MFDLDQFIADCRTALAADHSHKSVREVVARAVSSPRAVLDALGEPKRGMLQTLYRSEDLTILNVVWPPYMTLMPHNHQMWGVIGIYTDVKTTFSGVAFPIATTSSKPSVRKP
jgi:predicted metal-dependent enzyme (double-stranded beta helix superfamily)